MKTGKLIGGDNYCCRSVDSHWARGTAWAIYGFVLAYRYTKDARYLDASKRIARRFISLLDDEIVPVWDFRLSQGFKPIRDASAAAIAICGLKELVKHDANEIFTETANRLLARLCTEDYLNFDPACAGILRNAQVGDGLDKARSVYKARNAYTSWGDYFLMEGLAKELYQADGWW